MSDTEELKNMILNFRVSELQVLLGFAGRNKSGKKQELQGRALDLVKLRSAPVQMKIRELHKRRFHMVNMAAACDAPDPSTIPCALPPVSQMSNSSYPMQRSNAIPPPMTMNHGSAVNYMQSQGNKIPPPIPTSSAPASYPVYPDVKFKPLPFYDVTAELLKPASLVPNSNGRFQENTFQFHLTPQQAHDVAFSRDIRNGSKNEHIVQIQLRFCLLETSCEQDDNFPPSICVKCNGKICSLPNPIPTNKPGVEPKRPSRPVNITPFCKLSPVVGNAITVSWASEYGRAYAVAVYLVKKLTSTILLNRLKGTGARNPDHTRAMIKEKLKHDPDSEIATTSLRGSLMCPLGKMRMTIPCRAVTCMHLQCFDASLYLQMNEKKPTWICPVCDKPATFKNLIIDGLFTEITTLAPPQCTEVQFHEDGSWTPLLPKKDIHSVNSPVVQRSPEKPKSSHPEKRSKVEVVDLTLESDDDSVPSVAATHISPPRPQSSSSRAGLPSTLSLPPSLSVLPASDGSTVIPLPSPNSSPSSSLSSSSSSVILPYNTSGVSTSSTVTNSSTVDETSELFPNSILTPNSRSSATSGGVTISAVPQASSSSSHSPGLNNPLYPSISLVTPTTPPYYPPVSSPFPDFLPSGNPVYNTSSYSSFDLYSLLQPSETERQVSSYSTVNSNNGRKTSSSTPDVISLD